MSLGVIKERLYGGSGDNIFTCDVETEKTKLHGNERTSLKVTDGFYQLGISPIPVEILNLEGNHRHSFTFSPEDVYTINSMGHLVIKGDSNTVINLEGEHWTQQNSENGFTVYTSQETSISIDDHIVHNGGVHVIG